MSNVKVEKQEPQGPSSHGAFEEWYDTKFKHGFERGPNDKYVARMAWFAALYTAPQPCQSCEVNEAIGAGNTILIETLQDECEKLKAELARTKALAQQSNQDHLNARKDYQGEIIKLKAERDELAAQVTHWKANHASVVAQARILKERPDMPIERVKAYENWVAMAEQVEKMRTALGKCRYDSLNMSLETWREIREAANLPDLSTGILNRVRAEMVERCAKVCDELASGYHRTAQGNYDGMYDHMESAAEECATDIRALAADMGSNTKENHMLNKPVVVSSDANPDDMNSLHGEGYGTDWIYPSGTSFDIEKLACKYCEQYSISEKDPIRPAVINAFCIGVQIGRKSADMEAEK